MIDTPGRSSQRPAVGAAIDLPGPARVTSIIQPVDPGVGAPGDCPDGRTARRARNREAVIRAMLELIDEGELDPATAKIAERAGVSHRSVFRYFDDLGDLVREAINIAFASAVEYSMIHDIGAGPLDHRIDAFVQSNVDVYQNTYNASRVARFKAGQIEEIDRAMSAIAGLRRTQLRRQFAPEFAEMPEDQWNETLDALLVMTDFTPYDIMRRMLDYDDERIARTWRRALAALLS